MREPGSIQNEVHEPRPADPDNLSLLGPFAQKLRILDSSEHIPLATRIDAALDFAGIDINYTINEDGTIEFELTQAAVDHFNNPDLSPDDRQLTDVHFVTELVALNKVPPNLAAACAMAFRKVDGFGPDPGKMGIDRYVIRADHVHVGQTFHAPQECTVAGQAQLTAEQQAHDQGLFYLQCFGGTAVILTLVAAAKLYGPGIMNKLTGEPMRTVPKGPPPAPYYTSPEAQQKAYDDETRRLQYILEHEEIMQGKKPLPLPPKKTAQVGPPPELPLHERVSKRMRILMGRPLTPKQIAQQKARETFATQVKNTKTRSS